MATIDKKKKKKSSIQASKALIAELGDLGKKGDTYEAIIWRLLKGCNPAGKGEPHEGRGDKGNESTGIVHKQEG